MDRILTLPAFVASLAPRDMTDARRLVARVPPRASAIEYRLDLAQEPPPASALLELDPRPAILTWRTMREGGDFRGAPEEYRRRILEAYEAGATVDVEHASGLLDGAVLPDRRRVVVSRHSPFGMAEDVEIRLDAMLATGARGVKLVGGAGDLATSLRIADRQRRRQGEPVAIFPMGPASPPGRVLSALFGAALVYGPVERETAAGQIPIADLLDVYRVDRPRRIEALYGVVGQNTSHSISPAVHNALFRSRGLPCLYLPLPVSDFEREAPHRLDLEPPFRGFSVTQPWKTQAARTGARSADVSVTQAAYSLVRDRRGWRAENTDVDGVFDALADHDTGEGRSAVILGAGGVARAATLAARRLGYEVAIAARRVAEADRLAAELGADSMAWDDVAGSEADLYLNATPVGWRDDDPSILPEGLLENRPLVFDCVYRRDGRDTSTIRAARVAGCPTVDGLQMFAAQAARQAQLFGVEEATVEQVARIVREAVGR